PFWMTSSWLMQRISVDLPEPEGPQITMRSPLATVRSISFSAWNEPYHLSTPSILTATAASSRAEAGRTFVALKVIVGIRAGSDYFFLSTAGIDSPSHFG